MNSWKGQTVIILVLVCSFCCQRSNQVELAIDFTKASQWRYLFGVDIRGELAKDSGSTSETFRGNLRSYLQGGLSPHDPGVVSFRTTGTRVSANFLDEEERTDLEYRFENMNLSFSPNEGAFYLPDTFSAPSAAIGGWDLLRNFARVLPILPSQPVSPGSTWDRERQFPLETNQGQAIGHLYQSFQFDSTFFLDSTVTKAAAISWLFSYRVELIDIDTAKFSSRIPLQGEGRGSAIIDLNARELLRANASFGVPDLDPEENLVAWHESVHLEIVK